MSEKVSDLNRRQFLSVCGVGAATVVGGSMLAACTPTATPNQSALSGTGVGEGAASGGASGASGADTGAPLPPQSGGFTNLSWLGESPKLTDADCNVTETADVIVVGAGVAGISAARAAADAGASVIVVEQTEGPVIRGLVFGALDSSYQKSLGATYDNNEVVNEICRGMGNRPNQRLWMKWANESGAAFDWFEEALDASDEYFLEFWPNPPKYDNARELRKQYCTGIEFVDWVGAVTKHYNKSVEVGAVYAFSKKAVQLAQDSSGAVVGVYAQAADGSYVNYQANNGVVLCTGDYGHNIDMVAALCPEFYWNTGGMGTAIETSNGDGHRMALWAGGWMEPAPHAHMDHTFASMGGIGNAAALSLNVRGERYMNEDCDGQSMTNQINRQPEKAGIQVFDSTYASWLDNQPISHGMPGEPHADPSRLATTLQRAIDEPSARMAGFNTLEELFAHMGMPVETSIASVKRYNELCADGKDLDFGKRADRLNPVSTPPFFAARSLIATGVMTAGVMVNENLQVIGEDFEPIGNLWAAGNVAGGRYADEYPVYPVVATSHGTAITFGRSCGTQAANA